MEGGSKTSGKKDANISDIRGELNRAVEYRGLQGKGKKPFMLFRDSNGNGKENHSERGGVRGRFFFWGKEDWPHTPFGRTNV